MLTFHTVAGPLSSSRDIFITAFRQDDIRRIRPSYFRHKEEDASFLSYRPRSSSRHGKQHAVLPLPRFATPRYHDIIFSLYLGSAIYSRFAIFSRELFLSRELFMTSFFFRFYSLAFLGAALSFIFVILPDISAAACHFWCRKAKQQDVQAGQGRAFILSDDLPALATHFWQNAARYCLRCRKRYCLPSLHADDTEFSLLIEAPAAFWYCWWLVFRITLIRFSYNDATRLSFHLLLQTRISRFAHFTPIFLFTHIRFQSWAFPCIRFHFHASSDFTSLLLYSLRLSHLYYWYWQNTFMSFISGKLLWAAKNLFRWLSSYVFTITIFLFIIHMLSYFIELFSCF